MWSLLDQAKELTLSLSNRQAAASRRDWKLVLLVASVDELCMCSDEVILTDHRSHQRCHCEMSYNEKEYRLRKAILTQALQESLDGFLRQKLWYSDREDFTVVLHPTPIDTNPNSIVERNFASSGLSSLHADKLALQLWANLLHPVSEKMVRNMDAITEIPCPTEDHPFLRTERNSPLVSHLHEDITGILRTGSSLLDPIMGSEMPCEDRSPSNSIPVSVHTLRPADIKVVAAVGDSLTAANGAGSAPNDLLDVLKQYRGLSWSIGGDENLTSVTTLPNILRQFNPSLTGFSEGTGKQTNPRAFLNQAVPGATSEDMPGQVRILADKMKNDLRIDFSADWKVITMFVGGNDLCDHCIHSVYFSADNFVSRIKEALDILHKEVPRALVNLVEVLDIVPLRQLHRDSSLKCPTWLVKILCHCIISPKDGSVQLQRLTEINRAYQRGLQELIESGRYDTHSNFTVVLQPFFREITVPLLDGRPDRSFFTPDCFHLSQKSHTLMARALWNNMLEPVGNKTHSEVFTSAFSLKCPTKTSPYLRTYQNSNYTYKGPAPTPPPVTNWGSNLSCADRAPSSIIPTSVHKLRPGDIKVVAALGDSITAGYGAKSKNIFQLKIEYRGVSWNIGGDQNLESVTTLPNILREFNPLLRGFSVGQGSKKKGLNMAVSGAKASQVPGQVQNLIQAMKDSKEIDFEKDWKLITLFIGGNDLCQYCLDQNNLSPQNYSHHLRQSLDLLYRNVPRVMVNVLELLQIEGLRRIKSGTLGCSLVQRNMCPCILIPSEDSIELNEMKRINREYQAETELLISQGRYDVREDFTVVIQPFFQNSIIPLSVDGTPDLSYFSADCFHFSERGHAEMAIALWNNMLEPVGRKQTFNNFTYDRNKIKCPSEAQPYIYTRMNSLPSVPTATPAPSTPVITTTTLIPLCPPGLPLWLPVVFVVIGSLIGWGITWLFLSYRKRNDQRKQSMMEMKGTEL
ncbi:phospholipase B1, membrane-associated-like [Scleropages formosus]|uniref:phospholipase B1, membrane-associated-like n=1 Tax=Scleropages formosus TaxID=113540 RepID=UPI0010FA9076|nr:phospholipase B1, membrane-associated-like [Scleropages formosus]